MVLICHKLLELSGDENSSSFLQPDLQQCSSIDTCSAGLLALAASLQLNVRMLALAFGEPAGWPSAAREGVLDCLLAGL